MGEERKKALWPWITAMLVALPVPYVASFGPVCGIGVRFGMTHAPSVYRPLLELGQHSHSVHTFLERYAEVSSPRTGVWGLCDDPPYFIWVWR